MRHILQHSRSTQHKHQGYTLIELMIANGLGIMLIVGVVQIFTANSQSIRVVDASARVQESGRIGLDMMAKDIRMADYWGCAPTGDILNHLKTSDLDYNADIHNPTSATGLDGQNNVASGVAINTIDVLDGSDTITFRGASPLDGVKIQTPYMNVNAATIHINTGANLPKGMLILITNCKGGDFFSNTNQNTSTSGNIIHSTGNLPAVGNIDNLIKNLSQTYTDDAVISSPYTKTYFIGTGSIPGTTSLYRYQPELPGGADEIIPNVVDMQLVYGDDTNSNGSVNRWADSSVVTLDNAIAVRITLTIESPNDNIVGGEPLRREYSITSTIRNRLL
ncbi:MAG: PilW family protein [Pseudomonadales bacterium]|nr:PilW family protein [Pseudomonadales bacterium]